MQIIDDFITMVKNEKFAEAHEVLEDDWKAFRKEGNRDESYILKGFINGATSFELKRRGRDSASRVWATYEKYRPLIDETDSLHVKKYEECALFLEAKHDEVFLK